jgi:hypothetical protein
VTSVKTKRDAKTLDREKELLLRKK